jgi:hypothetical protein
MKINKFFATNEHLEEKGVWHEIGDGAKVLVARNNNKNHAEELKRLIAPYRRQIQMNKLPDEVYKKISIEAMAKTILLGWVGFEDDNGKELKYSIEAATDLLTRLPDFRNVITSFSDEMDAYQQEAEEGAENNS